MIPQKRSRLHAVCYCAQTLADFGQLRRPSSKGKPTDPKLREEVKEDVKNETNKDGSGKGQMAAWKVSRLVNTLL
jgi:hypothetical protein